MKINNEARLKAIDLAKNARCFPNIGVLGRYDPLTQIVTLDSIDEKTVSLVSEQNDFVSKKKLLPLLAHECRHWFDHISTVWGRQQLVAIYNAMNARAVHGPQEYHRIPAAFRQITLDSYPRYFSTVTEDHEALADRKTWLYETTSGQRFSYEGHMLPDRPILFSRFMTQSGKDACRCPFSIESLLETSAVRDEMLLTSVLISELSSEGRLIEGKQFADDSLKRMYTPQLVKYSVAAHAVANSLHLTDISTAIELSSQLASVCLNLPDSSFESLKIPDNLRPWSHLHPHYLAQRDRGYLFVAISFHGSLLPYHDAATWVDKSLALAGLGGIEALNTLAKAEISGHVETLDGPFRERLLKLLAMGEELFALRGVTGNLVKMTNEDKWMPPIILGDGFVLKSGGFKNKGIEEGLEKYIDDIWDIEGKMREFVDACGM